MKQQTSATSAGLAVRATSHRQLRTRQQLVERLLALVVAAAHAGAAGATHRVNLINENDAGGVLLGLRAGKKVNKTQQ
jgi:hypothetical protein